MIFGEFSRFSIIADGIFSAPTPVRFGFHSEMADYE
jgi:hypothetical protein